MLGGPPSGPTWYVSATGSDAESGLTPAAAWLTLRRASLQPLTGGASLLLARNSTWLDDPLTLNVTGPANIGAFGDASLPRPLLQMPRTAVSPSTCSTLHVLGQVTVSDLHLSGCSTGVRFEPSRPASGITIEHSFFSDIRTPFARYSPPNPRWAAAIQLGSGTFANVTVRHNIASRVDTCERLPVPCAPRERVSATARWYVSRSCSLPEPRPRLGAAAAGQHGRSVLRQLLQLRLGHGPRDA